jgi:hypothetical protein
LVASPDALERLNAKLSSAILIAIEMALKLAKAKTHSIGPVGAARERAGGRDE